MATMASVGPGTAGPGGTDRGEGDSRVTPATPSPRGHTHTHTHTHLGPSSPPAPGGPRGDQEVLCWVPVPWGHWRGQGTSWAEPRAAPGDPAGRWLHQGALRGDTRQALLSPAGLLGVTKGALTSATSPPSLSPVPAAPQGVTAGAVSPVRGAPGGCRTIVGTGFAKSVTSPLRHSLQVTAEVDLRGQTSSCHLL